MTSLNEDSIQHFFDNIEILKWAQENKQAINRLTDFIRGNRFTNSNEDLMHAYNELAENYRWLGDTMNTRSTLNEIENVFKGDSSTEITEFIRFVFYKGKFFRSKGQLDSARYYHRKALELAVENNSADASIIGEIWMDLGLIDRRFMGNILHALTNAKSAQENFHRNTDKWHVKRAVLYYELAILYRTMGDFERAVNYARMAELVYLYYGDQFISQQINCKVVQGNCYYENGKFREANLVYEEVLKLFLEEVTPTRDALLKTLSNNGVALLELGEYKRARQFIERAININPLEYLDDSIYLAKTYLNLGLNLEQLDQSADAEEFLHKSLHTLLNCIGHKHLEVFRVYRFLGKFYENSIRLNEALDFYQKSLIAAVEDFNEEGIYSNPESFDSIPRGDAFYILFDKARALKKRYSRDGEVEDLLAAFDLYVIAYELIREAANSDFMEESLLEIPRYFKDDLNHGVECALELYENTENPKYFDQLLQFVETNKYFLLQNSVAKSTNKETLGIPDSAYQLEKDLLQEINALKREINSISFENREAEYHKRLALLTSILEWEEVRKLWNTSNRSSFMFSDLRSSYSLDSIRNQLIGDSDMLLEYFQTKDTLYTIVIDKKQEKILRTPKTPELEFHIENYLAHLLDADPKRPKSNYKEYVVSAHFLYKKLVYPAISKPDDQPEIIRPERLIIIPDGRLSFMPFESLIREQADTIQANYWTLNYLCRDYIINYGYSVNILGNSLQTGSNNREHQILAFSYSSSGIGNTAYVQRRDSVQGELPFSADELMRISKWIDEGKFYEGDKATEHIFKRHARDHNLIHLALHGYGDTLDMLNSRLVFKAPGKETEDGRLYAHELYGIDLSDTKLAVLSACETGVGVSKEGEGVYSLARGFAYAGCPAIVMSLWKVNDKATAELMDYFYENLSKGIPKDEALQMAKLTFIRNTDDLGAHPSNWAAFISLGNNEPLVIEINLLAWHHWMLLVLVIIGGALLYNIKMRRSSKIPV